MKQALILLLLAALAGCRKDNPDPASQLPPATQTGANTFGCLVNGQPWTPQGNTGTSNFYIYPTWRNGDFGLSTYRIESTGRRQYLNIGATPVTSTGAYSLALANGVGEVLFSNFQNGSSSAPCEAMFTSRDVTYRKGNLRITRFDPTAGVISGTFEATIGRTGCDTIKITAGRFDGRF